MVVYKIRHIGTREFTLLGRVGIYYSHYIPFGMSDRCLLLVTRIGPYLLLFLGLILQISCSVFYASGFWACDVLVGISGKLKRI
jgi:hypothetical protein